MKCALTLFTGVLLCFFISCQKEVMDTDPENSALFNLPDTDCIPVEVQGNYFENYEVTSAESIDFEIEVVRPGSWKCSTDTLNGMYFSGEGVFSGTGKQQISLKAGGKPVKPGNYRFLISDTLPYSFLVSVLRKDVELESIPQKSYFKGIIDGVEFNFEASLYGPDSVTYAYGGGDTASFGSYLIGGTYPFTPGPGIVSLQRNYLMNYFNSTDADFKNLFKPGAYAFANRKYRCDKPDWSPGIMLGWGETGNDTEDWVTVHGSAEQEGSSFVIVGIEDGYTIDGEYYVKVKSRFNCKLYRYRDGAMKELKDGEMVSYFLRPAR